MHITIDLTSRVGDQLVWKLCEHVVDAANLPLSEVHMRDAIRCTSVERRGHKRSFLTSHGTLKRYHAYLDSRTCVSTDKALGDGPVTPFGVPLLGRTWVPHGFVLLVEDEFIFEHADSVVISEPEHTVLIFNIRCD